MSAQQCFRCIRIVYMGSMEDVSLTKSGCDHRASFSSPCLQRCFSLPLPVLPLFSPLYQLFVSTLCLLGTEDKLIANGVCQTTSAVLAAILNKYFLLLPDPVCGYYGLALKIAPKVRTDRLCVSHVCKKFVLTLFEITSKS